MIKNSKEKAGDAVERNCHQVYGCAFDLAVSLNDGRPLKEYGSSAHKYASHRQRAKDRGIAWEFTFPEWLRVWKESGKWERRGKGSAAYCMARHGDVGPYSTANVSIITNAENAKECMRRNAQKIARLPRNTVGCGKGWVYRKNRPNKPYVVMCQEKYIGAFSTQHEAETAYRLAVEAAKKKIFAQV